VHRADRGVRPPAHRRHGLPALNVPLLLLFDIDGTLLRRAAAEHAAALHEAIGDVYGVASAGTKVEVAGRTDLEITRAILLQLGVSARRIDEGLDDLRVAASEAYARRVPADLSSTVLPGMADLLAQLEPRDDVLLSLVTGNLQPIARLKLGAAGVGHYFPAGQGGFGSDSEDRTRLPAVARMRAGSASAPHPRERTVVIGDTPRDIACARADGVRALAVATGPYRVDDLGQADAVAADGHALGGLIRGLLVD
jgi:phosphoglycolate phosphatase-like HAD superfamily hydrolase